jgi:hypothetical protein
MPEIYVEVKHFNFRNKQAELNELVDKLKLHNFIPFYDKFITRRPAIGQHLVKAFDTYYQDVSTFQTIHDLHIGPDLVGYYLILPPGCRPAAADPDSVMYTGPNTMPISRAKQAVHYMLDHKCTAYAAAKACGVSPSNMYITIERMQRNGEI